MQAKIQTKSNYLNLNGTWQVVEEMKGKRVTCTVFHPEYKKFVQVDFTLKEVAEFDSNV